MCAAATRRADRVGESIEFYKRALEINPGYHDCRFNLARAYRIVKNYAEAENCFKSLLPVYYAPDLVLNEIGVVFCEQGKFEEAIVAFEDASVDATDRDASVEVNTLVPRAAALAPTLPP